MQTEDVMYKILTEVLKTIGNKQNYVLATLQI